jgi:ABC-type glycerol-3-phosphate transport system substrate-binding protein
MKDRRGVKRVLGGLLALCLVILSGCSALPEVTLPPWGFLNTPAPPASPTPNLTPSPLPPETPQVTPTPAAETLVLDLWVPGFLYADSESPAARILSDQVNSYAATLSDTEVRISAKRDTGIGGMLNLISTAVDVAPSVVPDVVLINQHDLIVAADAGLLLPLDDTLVMNTGHFSAASSAVTTTQGTWALPYVGQAEHMAYDVGLTDTVPLSWTAVLSGSYQMLFPAGPPEGVATDALLAMYLGAGGRTMDQAGQATLDRVTLEQLYGFFADMREAGLLDVDTTLGLTDARASWARYQEGLGHLTPVPLGVYWTWAQVDEPEIEDTEVEETEVATAYRDSAPMSVPTPDGTPITILHTWGFAVLTDDPGRGEIALGLIRWLTSPQRVAELSRAAALVPTQRQAVAAWSLQPDEYVFVERLLSRSVRPCPPSVDPVVRRALQAGLSALLLQEVSSAEQAASFALTSLRR